MKLIKTNMMEGPNRLDFLPEVILITFRFLVW